MSTIHKEADGSYFYQRQGCIRSARYQARLVLKSMGKFSSKTTPITEEDKQAILATNKDLKQQALQKS